MAEPDEARIRAEDFARIADAAPVPMWVSRLDRTRRFANRAYCEFLGLDYEASLQFDWRLLLHPDDAAQVTAQSVAGEASLRTFSLEGRYRRADGEWRWIRSVSQPQLAGDGSLIGYIGVAHDVTDARLAEQELRRNTRRLAFLDALGRATAATTEPAEVLAIATRMLGEHQGLSHCAYADLEADEDTFHVRGDWHAPGASTSVGTYRLAVFGSRAAALLRAGEPLVVDDVAAEPGGDAAGALLAIGSRAAIVMPLVKEGRLIALMAIHASEPRTWREDELALLREVTDRCWAHVERVHTQAALAMSDERLRMAVEGGQIGTWDYDLVNQTGIWSTRTYAIMGVKPGTAVTPDLRTSLIHPDDRETTMAAVARLAQRGSRVEQEYRICRPDGSTRWVATHGMILRDTQGRMVRATGTMRDVTERRTAQAALAQLNQTLEQRVSERTAERDRMWRLSRDLLVVIGPRWDIRAVNPAVGAFGYAADDVIGRRIDGFIHPEDREAATRAIRAGARRPVDDFVARVVTREGEWRYLSWSAAPGEGEAYVIGRDVTGEMQRRAELDEAREALRQAQKVEAIGQLTGGVAHDFNNLLTPIIGNLDLLQRLPQAEPAKRQRLIGSAMEAANRARTLVQRLLAFARRQPLRPGAVDLSRLVRDMADLVGSTFGPQFRIVVDAPDAPVHAVADANQLELALLNLAVNARDAMPAGGVLTLALAPATEAEATAAGLARENFVRLSISDTGEGMEEAVLARAIEPFFSTKEPGKGTGLGLSMVHGLASQLGGAMRLASRPGIGTAVTLLLPAAEPATDERARAAQAVTATPTLRRVLLVDDDPAVRATTRAMLDHLGFRVREVSGGREALAAIDEERPDVLVTDHVMPGMTGAVLAGKARERLPGLPILVISGYADLADIAPDLPRLAKPFRADELSASLAALT